MPRRFVTTLFPILFCAGCVLILVLAVAFLRMPIVETGRSNEQPTAAEESDGEEKIENAAESIEGRSTATTTADLRGIVTTKTSEGFTMTITATPDESGEAVLQKTLAVVVVDGAPVESLDTSRPPAPGQEEPTATAIALEDIQLGDVVEVTTQSALTNDTTTIDALSILQLH